MGRQRLLDACTEHALADGLPDRLAPLAAAAGTSDRMLLYHFGSRDLLRAVLAHARQRQLEPSAICSTSAPTSRTPLTSDVPGP